MGPEMGATGSTYSTSIFEESRNQLNSREVGNVVLQGPLLKRSETVRQWEWQWIDLHVLTGKLEYWTHGREAPSTGVVKLDAYSTVMISPVNVIKETQYDACCFYITTSQRREHFFCAQTPKAAEAWVATLRAAVSVRRAHNEASDLSSNNAHYKLGNVATVVAAANIISQDAAQVLQKSMTIAAVSPSASCIKPIPASASTPSACINKCISSPDVDSSYLMREELKVKDKEIRHLARDLKSRNKVIKELGDRLIETAEAAESTASSVHVVHKRYQESLSEVDRLRRQLAQAVKQIRDADARRAAALIVEEAALQEAHRCRLELGKFQERGVLLQAAMVHIDEDMRRLQDVHKTETAQRLEVPKSRIGRAPQLKIPVIDAILQVNNASEAGDVQSRSEEFNSENCGDDATLLYTSPASVLDLRVDESNAEALVKEVTLQVQSQFSDVDSKIDELILEAYDVQTEFSDTIQASELELAGTREGPTAALIMDSCPLPMNISTDCEAVLRTLIISTPELVSCATPTEDGGSPSVNGTDHREFAGDVCPTLSRLPEVSRSNGCKAVPSPPSFSASPLPDRELAGSCEDLALDPAPRLAVPSCQLPVNSFPDEVAGVTKSATSTQELFSGAVSSAVGASPSSSVANHHEKAASTYPTIPNLDDTALSSQSNSTTDCGGVLTTSVCTDSSSEAFHFANGSEDHCNTTFGNDVVETTGSDEVIRTTADGTEEVTRREVIVEKTVVKQQQYQGPSELYLCCKSSEDSVHLKL
nr:uncharacterized protein LOC112277660 isoform X2 [Physcomitrium patens]|eukprot:XP_024366018.1 uncharacterized protein LOC112277660 isoform X2 [Physcomitrella patens]